MKIHKYVGLDVHSDTTMIAVAEGERSGEVRLYGQISSDLNALEKVLRKLGGPGVVLRVVYEAGPTGFVVYRRLQQFGIACIVVAPSKTPQQAAVRQKNDRRDAVMLARLHRAGELTGINIPDAVDESVRGLTRARSDAVDDLRRAKQRLKGFWLRHGYRYKGKANWSEAHQRYLRELGLPSPALKAVLEESLMAITQATERVRRLEELIAVQVPQWRMYPAVQALMCLRGFQLTAAAILVAELGDLHRFTHPPHLMGLLGLVPRQHSPTLAPRSRRARRTNETLVPNPRGSARSRFTPRYAPTHALLVQMLGPCPLPLPPRGTSNRCTQRRGQYMLFST